MRQEVNMYMYSVHNVDNLWMSYLQFKVIPQVGQIHSDYRISDEGDTLTFCIII